MRERLRDLRDGVSSLLVGATLPLTAATSARKYRQLIDRVTERDAREHRGWLDYEEYWPRSNAICLSTLLGSLASLSLVQSLLLYSTEDPGIGMKTIGILALGNISSGLYERFRRNDQYSSF